MNRFPVSRVRLGVFSERSLIFAVVSTMALALATAPAAHAVTIQYTIDVTAFFSGQGDETVSGHFSYDTSTDDVTSPDLIVTGADIAGPFTQFESGSSAAAELLDGSGDSLTLTFTSALGGASDTVSSIGLDIGGPFGFNGLTSTLTSNAPISGEPISESSPVPEPSSIGVLVAAVALLGFSRFGARNKTGRAVEG